MLRWRMMKRPAAITGMHNPGAMAVKTLAPGCITVARNQRTMTMAVTGPAVTM